VAAVVALLELLAQVAVQAVAVVHMIVAHLIMLVVLVHLGKVTLEVLVVAGFQ
jgi:hypothetical protein